jgi:hypothetical protein
MAFGSDVPEILLVVGIAYFDPLDAGHGREVNTTGWVGLEGVAVCGPEVFVFEFEIDRAVWKRFSVFAKDIEHVLIVGKAQVRRIEIEGFVDAVDLIALLNGKVLFLALAEVFNLGQEGEVKITGFVGYGESVDAVGVVGEFLQLDLFGGGNAFVVCRPNQEPCIFEQGGGDFPAIESKNGT